VRQYPEITVRLQPRTRRSAVRRLIFLFASGLTLLFAPAARASLIFSVNDVTAVAGSTGNTTLEVSLTNSGAVATPAIAAFQFQLSVSAAAGVTFTDADIATANNAYIFGTNTLTPPLSFDSFPNTSFTASDIYALPASGVSIGAGQTVGLGRVTFDVAPSASGVVPITIVPDFTDSVLDPNGDPISLTYQFVNGSISVSAVPEPSSLLLALLGFPIAYLRGAIRARRPV
jgi:hypothetical protein